MSNTKDFKISNGVLEKYTGTELNVIIPDGVTEIGWWAFDKRKNIESIIIPESVTDMDESAFLGCSHLKKIIVPSSWSIKPAAWFLDRFQPWAISLIAFENFDKNSPSTKYAMRSKWLTLDTFVSCNRCDLLQKLLERSRKIDIMTLDENIDKAKRKGYDEAADMLLEYKNKMCSK